VGKRSTGCVAGRRRRVTALPTPRAEQQHSTAYILYPICYTPSVFQSIKSGFSCSIVFLAPRPIKSFDRARVRSIETRSDRPSLMNPSPSDCVSSFTPQTVPPLYYLLRSCPLFLHDDRSRRKQEKNTRIKKRTGTAKPEIRPQHGGCFSVAFGVALHFGSMKAIVVTQATAHTHGHSNESNQQNFNKEKGHQSDTTTVRDT
jgi:hypothetical protein